MICALNVTKRLIIYMLFVREIPLGYRKRSGWSRAKVCRVVFRFEIYVVQLPFLY